MATSTSKTVQVKDLTKKMELALKELTRSAVYVGIPQDKTNRDDDEPINNATIGYIQENGSPENNVPARPFLVPGIKEVQDKIQSLFRKAGKNALEGNLGDVERGLNAAGLVAQIAAKNKITEGIPPPLADSTLAARRAKGRTGTTPLIDTGQLLNSITYVVREE